MTPIARQLATTVVSACVSLAGVAHEEVPTGTVLNASERATALGHGPWPSPVPADPSNRYSRNPAAIRLGKTLFFDVRLSPDSAFSCASCHKPEKGFSDGLPIGLGRLPLERNTLTVMGLAGAPWFGWDGANDNLWAQSIRPILASYELGSSAGHLRTVLSGDTKLKCAFDEAFGKSPESVGDQALLVLVGKALAAYQAGLRIGRSPFDEFRDALERNDQAAMANYPPAARRGLKLFVGHARCSLCHVGPRFSNGEFESVGLPHFIDTGKVDPGRFGGIEHLRRSPVTLLGDFNDDKAKAPGVRTRHVRLHPRTYGQFKVPALRNVASTAPYMHAGTHATLKDVVAYYNNVDIERLHAHGERLLRPLNLDEPDLNALVSFLESLSGPVLDRAEGLPKSGCF